VGGAMAAHAPHRVHAPMHRHGRPVYASRRRARPEPCALPVAGG